MASELLQSISKDEIERAHFRSRRMFRMDMEHNRLATLDEGRDAGIIAVAKNLLKRGRPINEIIEDTGLSCEVVEGLRDAD